VITFIDVTTSVIEHRAITELNDRLAHMAITDPLTGLSNRRGALASAEAEHSRARRQGLPLAFLMIDLDHFKQVNDREGHAQGDILLQTLSKAMLAVTRTEDSLGRVGGEEFLMVLTETDCVGARAAGERVRNALEVAGQEAGVTGSIGVSCLAPGDSLDDLYRRADEAMYAAKKRGRNQISTPCPVDLTPHGRPPCSPGGVRSKDPDPDPHSDFGML
jgi:diguanylate cyclase (GGDEF)-like protein